MADDEIALAERLNRLWDQRVGGGVHPGGRPHETGTPPDGKDAALAATLDRLHARDDAPTPDRHFVARLRARLDLPPTPGVAGSTSPAVRVAAGRHRFVAGPAWPPAQVAVAAAVILMLLGGRLLGFGGSDAPPITAAPPSFGVEATVTALAADGESTACPATARESSVLTAAASTPALASNRSRPGALPTTCALAP